MRINYDPAFLFYSNDFITTTLTMSHADRGKFILILAMMHQNGRMSEEKINLLVGEISADLRSKFSIDKDKLWFNKRLESEIEKRSAFNNSRRKNGALGGRPKSNIEPNTKPNNKPKKNLPVNVNVNVNEDLLADVKNENLKLKWIELFNTKKWYKRSATALKATLETSKKYDDDFMIKIIDNTICGDYQGLYFPNTDAEYAKYKKLQTNTGQKHTQKIKYTEPDKAF